MNPIVSKAILAGRGGIDELGNANDAVCIRWIQDMATSHWGAVAHVHI